MKNLIVSLFCMLLGLQSFPVISGDKAVVLELGIGLGKSEVVPIVSLRYRDNNIEGHLGRWFGTHSSSVMGVGYTKEIKQTSGSSNYFLYSTGVAYIFNPNPERMKGHLQLFNRLAYGRDTTNSGVIETAFINYGLPFYNKGEQFLVVSAGKSNFNHSSNHKSRKSVVRPPDDSEDCPEDSNDDVPSDDDLPTKPGNGYGDDNHIHSGPPGGENTDKPGYGYGDTNHDHTGPPGQN